MDFFNSAVTTMSTLVTALGGGLGVWGVINLMEGYGSDNPCGEKPGCQAAHGGRRRHAVGPEGCSAACQPDHRLSGAGKRLCKA